MKQNLSGHKYSILIAEDTIVQGKKLQYVLTKFGYDVAWFRDGEETLNDLLANPEKYNLVISDYQMPKMDGLELLAAIKGNEELKQIPFILLTTSEDEEIFYKSLRLGANEFLNKPFRSEELKLRVQNLVILHEYQHLIESENEQLSSNLVEKNKLLEENLRELKSTNEQMKIMQEHLVQSSKMASLGTMGAGIAHEINNPLTIINSYNTRLKKTLDVGENNTERLLKINQSIEKAVYRIIKIVDHLKTFSGSDSYSDNERSSINLNDILENLNDFYGGLVSANDVAVEQDLSEDKLEILAFKTMIEQIFLNLITNAIHAMEGMEKKLLGIKSYSKDGKAHVEISDIGHGIPQNVLDKIFDPFFTTKSPNKGTGLGMGLVRSYLAECNGTIECSSQPGSTVFTVTFDLQKEAT